MSCLGMRKAKGADDAEPLLPQYDDDTSLQRAAHQKLHSYQMIRALSKGFMPSTEQAIINLRTLVSSDFLNEEMPGLSQSGHLLLKYTKLWLSQFIELLRNKNDRDQIQDFIWFLLKADFSIDTRDLLRTGTTAKARADASATYESVKTVGSLLLTNSDFRVFLSDLNVIGRQVFSDTAQTLSTVAEDAAKQMEPSTEENEMMKHPGIENGESAPPTTDDLVAVSTEITDVVTDAVKTTGQEAGNSLKENISGNQKKVLTERLKAAVTKLRKRTDYSDSVSTIGLLIRRYAKVYSRAVDSTINAVQEDVDTNEELDRAVKNGWSLLSSFGEKEAWGELEKRVDKVMGHSKDDPEFEDMMEEVANSVQKMLTDPDFFDSAERKYDDLKAKSKEIGTESNLRQDVEALLSQVRKTYRSVIEDEDIAKLIITSFKIWHILSPSNGKSNTELFADSYSVFIPLLIQAIQYIPIPRLEVSVPEIDLLLENLILEPGRTINNTSFLPFRLKVETHNDLSIHKARFGTVSSITSLVTVGVHGLSIRADEVGFWFRAHSGLLRLADQGIGSFELDDRGIDISLDVEIGQNMAEKMLTLKAVRVKIHHLSYKLRKSKFACLAWLFKPLLRPLLRKVLERQLATAIADFFHAANRELLFARERLRATRISDPRDLRTFLKAVLTRLTPADDPDLYTSVGIVGGSNTRRNIFAGVYAPGSMVKLWNEEAARAGEVVDDHSRKGWRNDIFDVHASNVLFS